MSKETTARTLTVVALLIVLGIVAGRKMNWNALGTFPSSLAAQATPQDAIYAMLDAARAGDAMKYLNCFSGQTEAALRQQLRENGEGGFVSYLQSTQSAVKGVALNEPQVLTDREVRVRVEYVFQDRNEVQFMNVEKAGTEWKISKLEPAERVKTLIPYGTPVR